MDGKRRHVVQRYDFQLLMRAFAGMRDLNPFTAFNRMLVQTTNISSGLILAVGTIGCISHVLYGIVWVRLHPADYENLWLRVVGAVTCFLLSLSKWWTPSWKRLLPWYWFFVVLYTLPFFSTYLLLVSNYAVMRSMMMMAMLFLLITVLPHPVVLIVNLILGMALGIGWAYHTIPEFASLGHDQLSTNYLPMFVFTIVTSLVFSRSNLKGMRAQERIKAVEALALAGSIAHEIRSPLAQLKSSLSTIGRTLPHPTTDRNPKPLQAQDLDTLYGELAQSRVAIERGLQVIAMTLDEVNAKPIDRSRLDYLSAAAATRKAVEEFSYENPTDRGKVTLDVVQDFILRGDETRYVLVLFNLLKNALYYFNAFPHARINITIDANTVVFHDTGPGMDTKVLAHVFEPFHTVGKPGGTGLGLAFCKRTMVAIGGDISCESAHGGFTRFTLRFPAVSQEELALHRREKLQYALALFEGKRLLVVDDLPAVRTSTKALLEPLRAQVDEAENGHVALQMLARGDYAAMVLDLSMPVMDGYAAAQAIRGGSIRGQEHLPIVVYTAESPNLARVKLENVGVGAFVQKPCSELELFDALCRAVEGARRREALAQASSSLAGKAVLLADDLPSNRKYLAAVLRGHGATVVEAGSAQEVLDRLQEPAAVDAIVTDINMPGLSGLEMTRVIRAMPPPRGRMPVIALTAHNDDKTIAAARAAGVDVYLVKPVEAEEFVEKLCRQFAQDTPEPANGVRQAQVIVGPPASSRPALVNSARLDRMRSLGLVEEMLPEALEDTRARLSQLQACAAEGDREAMRDVLHSLVGIAGDMGAEALRVNLRAVYAGVDSGQWPAGTGWITQATELFEQTERFMRAEYLSGDRAAHPASQDNVSLFDTRWRGGTA